MCVIMTGVDNLDDGPNMDVVSIPTPKLCNSCIKNHQDNVLCNLTRMDQINEIKTGEMFCCFAYEPMEPTINKESVFNGMEEYLNKKRIQAREDNIISFICGCYCQLCDNDKCNASIIMDKYQNDSLTASQMKEVNEFKLNKYSCKNHKSNEGFEMFAHKIEVLYRDGRINEMPGWYSPVAISELWNEDNDIADIEILFTDV